MIILAIETATPKGSLALVEQSITPPLVEIFLEPGLAHSESLLPEIEGLLTQNDLPISEVDIITVSIGPGSFTGIRVGLSAAKGLAFAAKKPLVGVPTLDALIRNLPSTALQVCPLIDARKGEVYAALYQPLPEGTYERVSEYGHFKPEELVAMIDEDTLFFGDGARKYGGLLSERLGRLYHRGPEAADYPRARFVAREGFRILALGGETEPSLVQPLYVRASDAELGRTAGNPQDRAG